MVKHRIDLERVFEELPEIPIRSGFRESVLERMHAAHAAASSTLEAASEDGAAISHFPRHRVRRIVAAAAVFVSVFGVLWHLASSSVAVADISFAEVVQRMRRVAAVNYTITIERDHEPVHRMKVSVADFGARVRSQPDEGATQISDFKAGKRLILSGTDKIAVPMDQGARADESCNPINSLLRVHEHAGRSIGRETLDGAVHEVFEIKDEKQIITVWVDLRTEMPSRVRFRQAVPTDKASNGPMSVVVIDQINWKPEVNESDFSLQPPEGYVWESVYLEQATANDLLEMLQLWVEWSDGRFPDKLDKKSLSQLLADDPVRKQTLLDVQTPSGYRLKIGSASPAARRLNRKARRGLHFPRKVIAEGGQWHYTGQGAVRGGKRVPVCVWKHKSEPHYHVIYSDLSTAETTAAPSYSEEDGWHF